MNVLTVISSSRHRGLLVDSFDRIGLKVMPVTPIAQPDIGIFEASYINTRFTAVILQPEDFAPDQVIDFLSHVRVTHPHIVFLLYPEDINSYTSWLSGLPDEWKSRLNHYFTLFGRNGSEPSDEFDHRVRESISLMREYLVHSTPNWRDKTYKGLIKVFVSSTAFDLNDARSVVYETIKSSGEFFPVMSDQGSLPIDSRTHSYDNCLKEVEHCDLFILIIGGRFGGVVAGENISITQKEFRTARALSKPIITFIKSDVLIAKELLKPYFKDGVPFKASKIVDDERIFNFIDEVRQQDTGNWCQPYQDAAQLLNLVRFQLGIWMDNEKNLKV